VNEHKSCVEDAGHPHEVRAESLTSYFIRLFARSTSSDTVALSGRFTDLVLR
jgi:hypothetical protein